jgi:hypothetical protein
MSRSPSALLSPLTQPDIIMSWTYSDGLSKLVSTAVKLSIKSFAVTELFVDLPESASVANLKVS